MFEDTNIGNILNFVDSRFVLNQLIAAVPSQQFRDAYNQSLSLLPDTAAAGLYWHASFKEVASVYGITMQHCLGKSGKFSMEMLTMTDQYWVPGAHNFPRIDAAIIRGTTLYALQYTVSEERRIFDVWTFSQRFMQTILPNNAEKFGDIANVHVVYVVPTDNFPTPLLSNNHFSLGFGRELNFFTTTVLANVNDNTFPEFPFLWVVGLEPGVKAQGWCDQ
jgi:hypothetical protein